MFRNLCSFAQRLCYEKRCFHVHPLNSLLKAERVPSRAYRETGAVFPQSMFSSAATLRLSLKVVEKAII